MKAISKESQKHFDFWKYINFLPDKEYLKTQHRCQIFFGGWVRGLSLINGEYRLIIE